MSIYDDADLSGDPEKIHIIPGGIFSDLNTIYHCIDKNIEADIDLKKLSNHIKNVFEKSENCKESAVFMRSILIDRMPGFSLFRSKKQRHRIISNRLMEYWRNNKFSHVHITGNEIEYLLEK